MRKKRDLPLRDILKNREFKRRKDDRKIALNWSLNGGRRKDRTRRDLKSPFIFFLGGGCRPNFHSTVNDLWSKFTVMGDGLLFSATKKGKKCIRRVLNSKPKQYFSMVIFHFPVRLLKTSSI